MRSQWEYFLKNLGIWEGFFTTFSSEGSLLEDVPSRLTLEGFDENQKAKLTLCRQGSNDLVVDFTSQSIRGGGTLFFANGAFSQAPTQFSPAAQFGGELSLIHENRRLRLVQLFDINNQLSKITLIREHLAGTPLEERPQLKIENLLGEWQGEAVTIYPDSRPAKTYETKMKLQLDSTGKLLQTLNFDTQTIISTGNIKDSQILFEHNPQNPVQVLLLPDGASATAPLKVQLGQPFFLELAWLIEPTLRQRMIRTYNQKGESMNLTLVTERKAR
ncbi:DUF3598 family protein [Calothrix rhizosoleniae]|uniref:DUF3598 family protein n=1 Tax=Calothrix rhizosoleniae TaxID=888997 RepID=UPI000B49D2A7|nr:DUF3598 family protein [Calothrix rhizosoleniae]